MIMELAAAIGLAGVAGLVGSTATTAGAGASAGSLGSGAGGTLLLNAKAIFPRNSSYRPPIKHVLN